MALTLQDSGNQARHPRLTIKAEFLASRSQKSPSRLRHLVLPSEAVVYLGAEVMVGGLSTEEAEVVVEGRYQK